MEQAVKRWSNFIPHLKWKLWVMHGLFETMPSPKAADLISNSVLHFKLLEICGVALPEVMTSGLRPVKEQANFSSRFWAEEDKIILKEDNYIYEVSKSPKGGDIPKVFLECGDGGTLIMGSSETGRNKPLHLKKGGCRLKHMPKNQIFLFWETPNQQTKKKPQRTLFHKHPGR